MMNFLNFTFSSFWHFMGVYLLITLIINGVIHIIKEIKQNDDI